MVWDSKSGCDQQQRERWGQRQEGQSGLGHLKEEKTVCKPGGCKPVIQT